MPKYRSFGLPLEDSVRGTGVDAILVRFATYPEVTGEIVHLRRIENMNLVAGSMQTIPERFVIDAGSCLKTCN